MRPLGPVSAEAPLAVHEIAGRDGNDISEEIAELRMPSKQERDEGVNADAERGDERPADDEARKLAENGPLFGGKRGDHWKFTT